MNALHDYAIYDIATGEIVSLGMAHDHAVAHMQVQEGQGVLIGVFDPSTHYVVNGRVKKYTEKERQRYNDRPSIHHTWLVGRKQWEDLRPADVIKAEQRALLIQAMHDLETKQPRILREMALDPADQGAEQRLQELDDSIAALRDKLSALN